MKVGSKFLIDGELLDATRLPNAFSSRAFLYADGFFESIRVTDGNIPLIDLHHGRIIDTLKAYKIELVDSLGKEELKSSLIELADSVGVESDIRIRLTIYRDGNGKFSPESNDATWVASAESLEENGYSLNDSGVAIDLFQSIPKTLSPFSNFKNLHSQLFIQASLDAQKRGLGDVVILNSQNQIVETTTSNIFLASGGSLYTPKLSAGPVGGVMRAIIINLALQTGTKVYECTLTPPELLKAEEVFLTNAVSGIRWVSSYRTKRYFNKTATKLLSAFQTYIS